MSVAAHKLELSNTESAVDRRTARRLRAESLPSLAARLVAGPDVTLIDVSTGGARFESDTRLLPGSSVGLRLVQSDTIFLVMARVVRSRVARLESGSLRYESAVAFDKECPMFTEAVAVAQPPVDAPPVEVSDVVATSEPMSSESPDGAAPAAELTLPQRGPKQTRVLTFTAVVPKTGPDVRRLLSSNRW
jgi:hypothetical protein